MVISCFLTRRWCHWISVLLFYQVSKVFVPGLLSPTFNLTNNHTNLNTPLDNMSTPANAGSRHLQRLDEVESAFCNLSNSRHSPTFFSLTLYIFLLIVQDAMPSPVSERRGGNIKHHEGSFLEDYTFQQTTPYIHALRDPVCNRVTLVGLINQNKK